MGDGEREIGKPYSPTGAVALFVNASRSSQPAPSPNLELDNSIHSQQHSYTSAGLGPDFL